MAGSRPSEARKAKPGKAATAPQRSSAGLASSDRARSRTSCSPPSTGCPRSSRSPAGQYPGIVKTKLDGVNQIDYLTGKSEKSARNYFFYYSGSTPSAVRYKNWKIYYKIAKGGAAGWIEPLTDWHFPLIQNIKRDPFEQNVAPNDAKSL